MREENFFTIVIPTRERCDTLEHTLRTCIMQEYDNLEIVVSDNYSQDNTREVVGLYKDARVRYINTGKRLSMSENYEFGLSKVTPKGYVIFLGDDDGLLPNAICDINSVINCNKIQVLRWDVASYFWPNSFVIQKNHLNIPALRSELSLKSSRKTIEKVLSFKESYNSLPVMYNYSAVSYEIIKKIKNISGKFYYSITPDVYSGFAIAGLIDNFYHSTRPYAIAGTSHHSLGASKYDSRKNSPLAKVLSENNIDFHKKLVYCRSLDIVVIEAFLQALDHLPYLNKFYVDIKRLMFQMMRMASKEDNENYAEIKMAVSKLGIMHEMSEVAKKAIEANTIRCVDSVNKQVMNKLKRFNISNMRKYINNKTDGPLLIDCSMMEINNIYDASLFCAYILKHKVRNVSGYKVQNK